MAEDGLEPSSPQPSMADVQGRSELTPETPASAPAAAPAMPAPQPPAFDAGALQRTIQEGFAQAAARLQPPAPMAPPPPPDPLRSVLAPVLAPIVQHQDLQTRAIGDQVNFYTAHRGDISPEEHRAVEAKFGELMMAGRPAPREDILAWHRGMNLEAYTDQRIQQRLDALTRAEQAQTLGPGLSRGVPGQQAKNARDATDEELAAFNRNRYF